MPYIVQDKRDHFNPIIDQLHREIVNMELDGRENNNTEGNLNYIVTRLLLKVYGSYMTTRYAAINNAMGVLSCVMQEFYRKVASPYENQKEFDNGPVEE